MEDTTYQKIPKSLRTFGIYPFASSVSVAYLTYYLYRSIAHSKEIYGDPDVFRPERFLQSELPEPDISDPRNIVFGHGRRCVFGASCCICTVHTITLYRICPGRLFAEAAVFLAISNIIATLNIRKSRDPLGREINPEVSFVSGFVRSANTSRRSQDKPDACAATLASSCVLCHRALLGLPTL